MKQLKAKLKAAAVWAKRELLCVEVALKSTTVAAVSGGLNAVYTIYTSGRHFELTASHLLELKSKFISGAFLGTLMYVLKLLPGRGQQQQSNANSAS